MLRKLPTSLGEALFDRRAGLEQILFERIRGARALPRLQVRSPVFGDGQPLPIKYSSDGPGLSPPLTWEAGPEQTTFFALIVEDADAPTPHPLVHAIVVNISSRDCAITDGSIASADSPGSGLATGPNSFMSHAWLPPDPPPGHGIHRYVFQVFAMSGLPFDKAPGREELFEAIVERGIAAGRMIGTYERKHS